MNGEDERNCILINIQKSQCVTQVLMADSIEGETKVNGQHRGSHDASTPTKPAITHFDAGVHQVRSSLVAVLSEQR